MRYLTAAIVSFFLFCNIAAAASEIEAARVKKFTGTALIVREGKTIPTQKEQVIFIGDTLRTGADGTLGVMFADGTCLSLGPDSAILVDDFLFRPDQGKFALLVRMIKGTAAYLSGMIEKYSPQSIRFETPVATVGVRGTEFLVQIAEPGGE